MLSVLLAVRDWPGERIDACLDSFERLPSELVSEFLVVDFGSAAPVRLSAPTDRARVIRLEASRWSLAEATNAAVLAARNELVAKTDADILISPDSAGGVTRAVASLQSGEFDLLVVQDENLFEGLSVAEAAAAVGRRDYPVGVPRPRWGQGTFTMFSRRLWGSIGGYDSRMTGWGSEDNDFCDRARRSGARLAWIPQQDIRLFHVWHPPTYAQTHVARERAANLRLHQEDRTVFRPLRFLHSDPTAIMSPAVVRSTYPLVSIAIATASRPSRDRMITETIGSFRGQISNDFEVVVVDNGSDDDSFDRLKQILGKHRMAPQIRLERLSQASIPAARNEISRIARGKFVCVVDDDDLALPNRLADHLRCFEREGSPHGSHGGWIDFDQQTGLIEKNTGKQRTVPTMLRGTGKSTNHPSSFYRTDVIRALPYDESLKLGSDWDLALRAAAMELRFAHTHSYVTLRRFHSSNVTLTGSSDQVTTGLKSRARTWELYNARQQADFTRMAAENDTGLECENDFSLHELLHLLPDYVGVWRIVLPFALLGRPSPHNAHATLLEDVLGQIDGDLVTTGTGIDLPIMFCSAPVRGCRRARRLVDELSKLIGQAPSVISDRQLDLDRSAAFDWSDVVIPEGGGMVISERMSEVTATVEALAALPPNSLLRAAMRVVSDHDKDGSAFYLIAPPTDSRVDAYQMMLELKTLTGLTYKFARAPHAPSIPAAGTDRFH